MPGIKRVHTFHSIAPSEWCLSRVGHPSCDQRQNGLLSFMVQLPPSFGFSERCVSEAQFWFVSLAGECFSFLLEGTTPAPCILFRAKRLQTSSGRLSRQVMSLSLHCWYHQTSERTIIPWGKILENRSRSFFSASLTFFTFSCLPLPSPSGCCLAAKNALKQFHSVT